MLDEDQRAPDVEPESPATFGNQFQDLRFVREAAAQQNQPGLLTAAILASIEGA